jgi:phosphate transport system protein
MARGTFHQEMQDLKNEILLLGSMVEDAVMKAVDALKDNDLERSRLVIVNDQIINRKSYEIEIFIVMLMATQQPAAHDLRTLASSLGICSELERIGDYAKGIAKINIRSGGLGLPRIMRDIYAMGEKSVNMLHRAITSFADEDSQTARDIIQEDDLIDECYIKLYNDAINSVLVNAGNIERANYVIWAAHNLERLGDRATNICERVTYMVTGDIFETFVVTSQLNPLLHED